MLLAQTPFQFQGLIKIVLVILLSISSSTHALAQSMNYMDSIVIVITDDSSATGFIAELNGNKYIFTTLKCLESTSLMRFQTLSGNEIKPKRLEAAASQDIVRLEFENSDKYPSAFDLSDQSPQIHDKITVIGNSDGDFVASSIKGTVSAVGPSLFEFSAPVNAGNRGAPILNSDGQVLGIFAYSNTTEGDEKSKPRLLRSGHSGIRADEILGLTWVGVSPSQLAQQTKLLHDLQIVHSHFADVYPNMKTEKTKTQERVYSRIFETRSKKWTEIGYKASNRDSFYDAKWYDSLKTLCDSHDKLVEMRFREGKALRSHDTRSVMNSFKGSLSTLTDEPPRLLTNTAWVLPFYKMQADSILTSWKEISDMSDDISTHFLGNWD